MKLNYLLIFIISLLPYVSFAKMKIINLGADPWVPYIIKNGEAISGFDYEGAKKVLYNAGYQLNLEFFPKNRTLYKAQKREIDGILGLIKTKKREEFLIFPSESISEIDFSIFYLKGKKNTYNTMSDLNGKTVGLVTGYAYPKEFMNSNKFKKFELSGLDGHERLFKMLAMDRFEFLIENRISGKFLIKSLKLEDKIDISSKSIGQKKFLYVAFSKKKGMDKVSEIFSHELKKFKLTEEYKEIKAKYE